MIGYTFCTPATCKRGTYSKAFGTGKQIKMDKPGKVYTAGDITTLPKSSDSDFGCPSYLKASEIVHTDVCQQFGVGKNGKELETIDSAKKPYVCICDAAISQASTLQKDERICRVEKTFVCGTCDAAFTEAGSLKTHEQIHTGENPYVYGAGDAVINEACGLKQHERIHTGENPYVYRA